MVKKKEAKTKPVAVKAGKAKKVVMGAKKKSAAKPKTAQKKKPAAKPKTAQMKKPAVEKSKATGLHELLAPSEADYLKKIEDKADKDDRLDMVAFYLNDSLFAVEVDFVGAVIMSREIVELPHTPDFIDGLISVRGEMILVMNLKRRLGMPLGALSGGNIIVTESSLTGSEAGMIVDRMAGVMEVDANLKSPSKTSSTKEAGVGFIKGVALSEEKNPIKVLDMVKLMDFEMPAGAV